jgi:NADPH-ferrihemoprotein reductase
VYYATQTGTAESFALQLKREGQDHGFFIHVVDMEETTLEGFPALTPFGGDDDGDDNNADDEGPARAIILASTYGEGEPTDNATAMVTACKEAIESAATPLSSRLEYAVFGLGNREYELFNAMGKFFDASLETLGATRIYELGLGDDNEDLEADFEKWKDGMWSALKERYLGNVELPTKRSSLLQVGLPECEYSIVYHNSENGTGPSQQQQQQQPTPKQVPIEQVHGSSKHYFTAIDCPVSARRELRTAEDGGSTVHIEIDISNNPTMQQYQTADNLGVLPLNQRTVVESVASSLGYDLDAVFSLGPAPTGRDRHEWHGDPFPMPITVRECLTRYLDLTSAPRRSDLKLLSLYARDPVDRRALHRLSSKEGKQQYKEKITESFVGMVDLLKLCPSLEIPLEHLISICHFMLPRFYTISSCPKVFPDSIHLTVAVTKEARKDGTFLEGVCSTYLSTTRVQSLTDQVRVFVRPSSFRLPQDPSKPIIMIGPGTGIAPMRALLQERRHQRQQQATANGESSSTEGANVLYFGCKRPDMDYLYQDELERYQKEGVLTELHLAFSRSDPAGKKVYVQHLLRQRSAATWKLLDEDGAYVYVCGGVKMGHDVTECLKEIVSTEGQRSMDQAAAYLTKLSSQGRYVQELWS